MDEKYLNPGQISTFASQLWGEELSRGTIEKYQRDIRAFYIWLNGRAVTKERAVAWKEHLVHTGYAPATVNAMVAGLNRFFIYNGWPDCRIKPLKLQRKLFRGEDRELTRQEYSHLLNTASGLGQARLAMVMETVCATGIRVSELRYLTVESVRHGRAEIYLKGKVRTILIPNKLSRKLLNYAKKQKITSGELFITRSGRGISRKQIWAEMKAICKAAGVAKSKVFPHNLRHLFARIFYQACRDVAKLADVLGHSSIETTRIYLVSTGLEHTKCLENLGLIS